jgi:hypothetical protein
MDEPLELERLDCLAAPPSPPVRSLGAAELERVLDTPRKRKKGERSAVYVGGLRTDTWRKQKREQERASSMQGMAKLSSYFNAVREYISMQPSWILTLMSSDSSHSPRAFDHVTNSIQYHRSPFQNLSIFHTSKSKFTRAFCP